MLIQNVKINGFRTAKAIQITFSRGNNTRNVWLAYSQIKIDGNNIEVADWLYHTAIDPLIKQDYIPPFDLPKTPANVEKICTVRDGTYTVVFDNDLDNYRTLQVKTSRSKRDFRIVGYLFGCDNTRDFRGFASPEGNNLRFWKAYETLLAPETKQKLTEAWKVIVDDPQKAGEAYAMRSGNCYNCGRKLTVPTSLHRGLGPDCYGRLNGN